MLPARLSLADRQAMAVGIRMGKYGPGRQRLWQILGKQGLPDFNSLRHYNLNVSRELV